MKLSEVFKGLTYGELSNIRCGGKKEGGIYPTYTDEVLYYVNQALVQLHTRFELKKNEVIIQLHEEVSLYRLTSAHAYSNEASNEYYKYIDDLGQYPFTDDIIKVDRVYNELGNELIINNNTAECTIYTPEYNLLHVTNAEDTNALSLVYSARHDELELDIGETPDDIEVHIQPSLLHPLGLYVAYLAYNSLGGNENVGIALGKLQQFEAYCLQIETLGTLNKDNHTNNRLLKKGWV